MADALFLECICLNYVLGEIIMGKLTEILKTFIEHQEISGAVCMVRKDGNVLFNECLGYADMEKRLPMTEESM